MASALEMKIKRRVKSEVQKVLSSRGYQLLRDKDMPADYDQATIDLFWKVKPYTLTSHERVFALRQAVMYIISADIPGAIVECGVWRGGSMQVIAHTLLDLGVTDRELYLFDTFETMPPPGTHDVDVWGTHASETFDQALASPVFAYLPQDQIKAALVATGYPEEKMHFVKGMVEETIPDNAPGHIALCRLDTDWYESTAHEMEHLYPRITAGGVLLIDDYGHYMGSKRAVDEYIEKNGLTLLLNRIDFSGRLAIIPAKN
jgi:hypothetical protein